jgi:hypothetical protein
LGNAPTVCAGINFRHLVQHNAPKICQSELIKQQLQPVPASQNAQLGRQMTFCTRQPKKMDLLLRTTYAWPVALWWRSLGVAELRRSLFVSDFLGACFWADNDGSCAFTRVTLSKKQ